MRFRRPIAAAGVLTLLTFSAACGNADDPQPHTSSTPSAPADALPNIPAPSGFQQSKEAAFVLRGFTGNKNQVAVNADHTRLAWLAPSSDGGLAVHLVNLITHKERTWATLKHPGPHPDRVSIRFTGRFLTAFGPDPQSSTGGLRLVTWKTGDAAGDPIVETIPGPARVSLTTPGVTVQRYLSQDSNDVVESYLLSPENGHLVKQNKSITVPCKERGSCTVRAHGAGVTAIDGQPNTAYQYGQSTQKDQCVLPFYDAQRGDPCLYGVAAGLWKSAAHAPDGVSPNDVMLAGGNAAGFVLAWDSHLGTKEIAVTAVHDGAQSPPVSCAAAPDRTSSVSGTVSGVATATSPNRKYIGAAHRVLAEVTSTPEVITCLKQGRTITAIANDGTAWASGGTSVPISVAGTTVTITGGITQAQHNKVAPLTVTPDGFGIFLSKITRDSNRHILQWNAVR